MEPKVQAPDWDSFVVEQHLIYLELNSAPKGDKTLTYENILN